jgi:hypothetical protein
MKRTAFFVAGMLGAMVLALLPGKPLAAQGIVSDEIWQLVDSLLHDTRNPQLNIDFNDVMGRMSIVSDDEGKLYLLTSIVVCPHEVDAYTTAIEEALASSNTFSSANARSGMAALAEYAVVEVDNNLVEILLYEALGTGTSRIAGDKGKGR